MLFATMPGVGQGFFAESLAGFLDTRTLTGDERAGPGSGESGRSDGPLLLRTWGPNDWGRFLVFA